MNEIRPTIVPNRVKKDGTTHIYLVAHHEGNTIQLPTDLFVEPQKWDPKKRSVKGKSQKAKDYNLIINKCVARANDIMVTYRLMEKKLTPTKFRKEYKDPIPKIDFLKFMDETITLRVKHKEITKTTEKSHRIIFNHLTAIYKNLMFADIDENLINDFMRKCMKIKTIQSPNTVYKYVSTWAAYWKMAKKQGIINYNPFEEIEYRRKTPNRVWLTEDELKTLMDGYENHNLPSNYHRVLRHFLFMCATGVRISDFQRLTTENIANDTDLVFIPHKTRTVKNVDITVPLNSYALKLIKDEDSPNDHLFNPISDQKMNNYIKEIADRFNIKKEIKNHSARHTFATLFLEKTNDVASLQRILGHSDIKTTMVYVHISNKKLRDQMKNFEDLFFLKEKPESK